MDNSLPQQTTEEAASSSSTDNLQSPIVEQTGDRINIDSETGEPVLIERTRHSFSYTANELRQRNSFKESSSTAEKPTKTTPASTDNYKDDCYSNGGGFYECNIW